VSDTIRCLFGVAVSCVFTKQSADPLYCGPLQLAPERAPLLPKLRGEFAEFLNGSSLERLGMFSLPTCVGLRYGHSINFERRFFSAVQPQPVYLGRGLGSPDNSRSLDRDVQHPDGLAPCVLVARQTPIEW